MTNQVFDILNRRRLQLRLMLWMALFWIGSGTASAVPLVLDGSIHRKDLAGHISYLEVERELSLNEVAALDQQGQFLLLTKPLTTPSGRLTHYWFKLDLEYDGNEVTRWVLDTRVSVLTRFELFAGPEVQIGRNYAAPEPLGIWMERPDNDIEVDRHARSFTLKNPGRYTIYVRADSIYGALVEPVLWDGNVFSDYFHLLTLTRGMGYGLIFATSLMSLGLLLIFRERVYLWSWLVATLGVATLLAWDGHLYRHVPHSWAPHMWPLVGVFPALGIFAYSRFSGEFLTLDRYSKTFGRALESISYLALLVCLLFALNQFRLGLALLNLLGLTAPIVMLAAGTYVLRRGFMPAKWFIVGFSMLLVSALSVAGTNLGLYTFSHRNELLLIGLISENLFFCVAQASRILRILRLSGISSAPGAGFMSKAIPQPTSWHMGTLQWESAAINVLSNGAKAALLTVALREMSTDTRTAAEVQRDAQRRVDLIRGELGPQEICVSKTPTALTVLFCDVPDKSMLAARTEFLLEKLVSDSEQAEYSSVGIAIYPDDGKDLPTLLNNSVLAQQYVGAGGGGGYAFYDEITQIK